MPRSLSVGDTGTIRAITDDGWLIAWDKGPSLVIDPDAVSLRVMACAASAREISWRTPQKYAAAWCTR